MFSSHFKWLNGAARRFSIRYTNTWRRSLCCGPVDSLANGARQYFKTRRPPDDDAQQKRAAAWYNNTTTTALSLKLSSQISSGMWRISGIWRTMMLADDDQIKIMTLYGSSFVLFGTDGRSVECNQSVKFLHPLYFSSHCHHVIMPEGIESFVAVYILWQRDSPRSFSRETKVIKLSIR